MTDIEQYIKYHVNIDFKRFNYLAESMKHIDDIDIYADAITKKLLNFIESSKTNKIDLSKLNIVYFLTLTTTICGLLQNLILMEWVPSPRPTIICRPFSSEKKPAHHG